MSNSLFVFTNNGDELLIKSAERCGIEVCNRIAPSSTDYVSTKLRRGMDTLKAHGMDSQYAMWVDGLDTLILRSADVIIDRLSSYGFDVVIAVERSCWPDAQRRGEYPAGLRARNAFINSGCFVGKTPRVLEAMQIVADGADDEDDQRAWTKAFLAKQLEFVWVDSDRYICVCQSDGRDYGTLPCVMHWNGRTPGRQEFFDGYFNGVQS